MSVTQNQLAEKLNISRGGREPRLRGDTKLPLATRERVEAMAREMGYDQCSNQAARTLIAHRHGGRIRNGVVAIAYFRRDAATPRVPYYGPGLEGMETAADELGIEIFLFPMHAGKLPRIIRERNVDGVIMLGYSPLDIAPIRALDLPVITYQARCDNTHSLVADSYNGTRLATRHLLEQGHRRIAFLGVRKESGLPSMERLQGYLDAMQEFDAVVQPEWVEMSLGLPSTTADRYCIGCDQCAGCRGWATLCDKNHIYRGQQAGVSFSFTGLVCYNDSVAMGAILHAQADGVMVPDHLSVTGFDDVSEQYRFRPGITSVNFPREAMGYQAMQMAHEIIENKGTSTAMERESEHKHCVFPTSLTIRESTRAYHEEIRRQEVC